MNSIISYRGLSRAVGINLTRLNSNPASNASRLIASKRVFKLMSTTTTPKSSTPKNDSELLKKHDSITAEKILTYPPEYPFPGTLEPADEEDYENLVLYWRAHFIHCKDRYELDRGLNIIFTCDWVPDVRVIEDAIRACRRLDDFPVAVRIMEYLEKTAYNAQLYAEYVEKLRPLLDELGIPERHELGEFKKTFKRISWRQ